MARKRGFKSRILDARAPEWEPLIDFAPEHLVDFMWMGALELSDKTRLQAYKHYWTRGYLHLDGEGRAFAYNEYERFEAVDGRWILSRVLEEFRTEDDGFGSWPPSRVDLHSLRLEWLDSATKNGISQERSEYVVKHCGLRYAYRPPAKVPRSDDVRFLFLGTDADGVELEVAGLEREPEADFLVLHAAAMRDDYRVLFERCRSWAG